MSTSDVKPVLKVHEIPKTGLIDPEAFSFSYVTDNGVTFKAPTLCLRNIDVYNAPTDKKELMLEYGEMIAFFILNIYSHLNHFPGFSSVSINKISKKSPQDG